MKAQKEKEVNELPKLEGQISLNDILANTDDGTYGKPADEFEVQ